MIACSLVPESSKRIDLGYKNGRPRLFLPRLTGHISQNELDRIIASPRMHHPSEVSQYAFSLIKKRVFTQQNFYIVTDHDVLIELQKAGLKVCSVRFTYIHNA